MATAVKKHTPTRKFSAAKYTTRPPMGLPEFEMMKPNERTSTVVVSVVEGRPSTSETENEGLGKGSAKQEDDTHRQQNRPRRPTVTIPSKVLKKSESRRVATVLPPPPPRHDSLTYRSPSSADGPRLQSATGTPVVSAVDSKASTAVEQTPVMRSMFPNYNKALPLAAQPYFPNPEIVPALTSIRKLEKPSKHDEGTVSTQTRPEKQVIYKQTLKEPCLERSESPRRPAEFSKPADLVSLWTIANGQSSRDAPHAFTLELSCEDLAANSEIITFSSSSSAPMYALAASGPTNISIVRIHPEDPRTKIQVCSSMVCKPARHDPLITSIFPKLAGLSALDQSSSAAVAQKLDRAASQELSTRAIAQAQEREASMLLWDLESNKFCLMHPTLLDSTITTIAIRITPDPISPQRITFLAPETQTPILDLYMPDLSLTIHTSALIALPSIYLMDSLMTALLSLLLHLHRSCGDPAARQTLSPQLHADPDFPFSSNPTSSSFAAVTTHVRNLKSASESESTLYFPPPPPSLYSKHSTRDSTKKHESWFKPHKEVDLDLDVESLRIRPKRPRNLIDNSDPALSKPTRAVLWLCMLVFRVLYWILGVGVQIVVLGVLGIGKFVTKL